MSGAVSELSLTWCSSRHTSSWSFFFLSARFSFFSIKTSYCSFSTSSLVIFRFVPLFFHGWPSASPNSPTGFAVGGPTANPVGEFGSITGVAVISSAWVDVDASNSRKETKSKGRRCTALTELNEHEKFTARRQFRSQKPNNVLQTRKMELNKSQGELKIFIIQYKRPSKFDVGPNPDTSQAKKRLL